MSKPVLLILAAGMGSRYGGLKQLDPLGPYGESIIDYSLHDAALAGFRQVVFVIKEEHRRDFVSRFGYISDLGLSYDFAYQSLTDLPAGFACPDGRQKPWGTGHAVYAARDKLDGPFGIIGADDFYGRDTFVKLYDFLSTQAGPGRLGMVGHRLNNTLPEHGSVSRGVCDVRSGMLAGITERTEIYRRGQEIFYSENGVTGQLAPDTIVSMIVWGLHTSVFPRMEQDFSAFLSDNQGDPLKREYYMPAFVDRLIVEEHATMQVLETSAKWYGVTHREDRDFVVAALKAMHEKGEYPRLKP